MKKVQLVIDGGVKKLFGFISIPVKVTPVDVALADDGTATVPLSIPAIKFEGTVQVKVKDAV